MDLKGKTKEPESKDKVLSDKDKLKMLKKAFLDLQQEKVSIEQLLEIHKSKLEEIQNEKDRLKDIESTLIAKTKQYDQLVEQYNKNCIELDKFKVEVDQLQSQLKKSQYDNEDQQKFIQSLQEQIELKEGDIQKYKKLNEQQQESIDHAYKGSQMLEEQIKFITEQISQFQVTKLGMINIDCLLILRTNINGQPLLEIESANDRLTVLAQEISDLIPDKEKKDQFSLVIKTPKFKRTEIFKSNETRQICKYIKNFLLKANVSKQWDQTSNSSGKKSVFSSIFK